MVGGRRGGDGRGRYREREFGGARCGDVGFWTLDVGRWTTSACFLTIIPRLAFPVIRLILIGYQGSVAALGM
jgi:hypothetical protein